MNVANWISPDKLRRIGIGVLLGLVPLFLLREVLFAPGYPYQFDGVSNLYPALHFRWSLIQGQLPIYTELWYGGEIQQFNPLWKGFYPFAWPLFIPGVPILPALKAILAVHYALPAIFAYYFLSEELDWWAAAPVALLFTTPMALFVGHYEKVLGWPWLVLCVVHLRPTLLRDHPRRAGLVAGVGLGVALLAGDNYHVFYTGLFALCVLIATRARTAFLQFARGGLVATPKVLFSILPVILLGADRPDNGKGLGFEQLVTGVAGFWYDTAGSEFVFWPKIFFEGYAAVGLPVVLLAIGVLVWSYVDPPKDWRWIAGVGIAALVGILLATRWTVAYELPVVEMFRVAARGVVLVSLSAISLGIVALTMTRRREHGTLHVAVAVLVMLSAANGVWAWSEVENRQAIETDAGEEVAADIYAMDCGSVWIEGGYNGTGTPQKKLLGYHLTKRGIPLQAVNYGKIGQNYTAVKNGSPTFDVLLLGSPMPENESVTLTGGWYSPDRGTINSSWFSLTRTYNMSGDTLYVYTDRDACSS